MLSRNARRDFAVEVKAAGRRNATHIPMREPKLARHPHKPSIAQSAEPLTEEKPKVTPAVTGRVLPSLIVQEPPQEAIDTQSDLQPRRPRGRPRKVVETQSEPQPPRPRGRPRKVQATTAVVLPTRNVETVAKPTPPVAATPTVTPVALKRPTERKGRDALPVGQRWKHRLSRWSR